MGLDGPSVGLIEMAVLVHAKILISEDVQQYIS